MLDRKTNLLSQKGITQLRAQITINASKVTVWNVLNKIGDIEHFHPLVKKSSLSTKAGSGLGAKRICELLPMGKMEEEVIDWEQGNSMTLEVVGGRFLPPYKFMLGTVSLSETDAQTLVEFTFVYKLKYSVLGKFMNALFVKPQFKKAPQKYVKGLKNLIEQEG